MASRKTPLVTGEIYHLYNRGVDKRVIFSNNNEYQRFLDTTLYYQHPRQQSFSHFLSFNSRLSLETNPEREAKAKADKKEPVIQLLSFDFQPNHFHLLVRQLTENGITKFMHHISTAYTTFFNTKYDRSGALFQGTFYSVHIKNDDQLIHVMRYIHLQAVVSGLVKKPEDWFWSSHLDYLDLRKPHLIDTGEILSYFPSVTAYQKFINDQIDYAKSLEEIKHLLPT